VHAAVTAPAAPSCPVRRPVHAPPAGLSSAKGLQNPVTAVRPGRSPCLTARSARNRSRRGERRHGAFAFPVVRDADPSMVPLDHLPLAYSVGVCYSMGTYRRQIRVVTRSVRKVEHHGTSTYGRTDSGFGSTAHIPAGTRFLARVCFDTSCLRRGGWTGRLSPRLRVLALVAGHQGRRARPIHRPG